MQRSKKIIISILLVLIVISILQFCSYTNKQDARHFLLRKIGLIARKYVFQKYKTGTFSNLAISNIVSLSKLPLPNDTKRLAKGIRKHITNCAIDPMTDSDFIFSPITPSGKVLCFREHEKINNNIYNYDIKHTNIFFLEQQKYFWMWTPKYKGGLTHTFIFLDGTRNILISTNVSWYYQCSLENLSPDELKKEKEYRKKKGLPELK